LDFRLGVLCALCEKIQLRLCGGQPRIGISLRAVRCWEKLAVTIAITGTFNLPASLSLADFACMSEAPPVVAVLPQLLILLAFSVLVVTAFRRLRMPPIVGYLAVGMLLGPFAFDVATDGIAPVLAELGVVFLVFTLGLEFSLPRMLSMRREALGIGGAQVVLTTGLITAALWWFDVKLPVAIITGGALAMSSTAIVIRQLGEQGELNRSHARIAVGILLFQDLAFVPLLALESALAGSADQLEMANILGAVARAAIALVLVLTVLRWLVRPLFHEIGRARSSELFTLTALLVSLGAAWATHEVGLSMALGAFLAGMLLAETEYRHQIESVIRPFRDVLLGLFFITIGTLLDLQLLIRNLWLVLLLVLLLQLFKAAIVMGAARVVSGGLRRSLRAGLIVAQGGEFGFALLTLMLNDHLADAALIQPLLAATVVGMIVSPFIIRHNERVANFLLRTQTEDLSVQERELAVTQHSAQRDHVIVCGYGRVGQNLARVLEQQGFEYIALDMDTRRVRAAREAGNPVVYGDGGRGEILELVGIEHCSVLVITFADPQVAIGIIKVVRELRPSLPVLVRTQDDTRLDDLQKAGATEVVPETLEASLMLASHLLLLLKVPVTRVFETIGDIRNNRYAMLQQVFRTDDPRRARNQQLSLSQLQTVVLPPGAYAVGRSVADMELAERAKVLVTGIRRDGILGQQPDATTLFREGDIVVLYGTADALAHGEKLLLMG
jgi:CPA2 family monovalent cation:H+ antiporter-2